jgi:hypothetical protein
VAALSSAVVVLAFSGCGSGPSGNKAAVEHVIETVRADVLAQRYAAACALLDPKLAASISSETLNSPKTCAAGLAAAYTRAPDGIRSLTTGPITMRDGCGYVLRRCHGNACSAPQPIIVCRRRDGWRVAAL